jgi:hypothetical protein
MNKNLLIEQLELIENAKRVNRLRVSNLVLNNPKLFPHLLELSFDVTTKKSIKAAWILELVCTEKLDWLAPHLNYFTKNIKYLKFDSAIRPVAKICMFLAKAFDSKKEISIKNYLTKTHIDKIIETGFDWMINKHKVATKAYTMETLLLFGKNYSWVHTELKLILEQNMASESPAYKARGRMTLNRINKK